MGIRTTWSMSSTGLEQVSPDLWFVKAIFHLGENQSEGLRYSGLRDRVLSCLGPNPLEHESLQAGPLQESTHDQLDEEIQAVTSLLDPDEKLYVPFCLDSTMAVVRRHAQDTALLTLISPVMCDESTIANIKALGEVSEIVVPSLQHWVFTEDLAAQFPEAKILWAPAACGEDMAVKLPSLCHKACVLENGFTHFGADLEARLLEGAALNMNEFLFHHKPSNTMIASDAFYGGHTEETTWFQRLWFKLTKGGSFKKCRLPVYRTVRVHSHGCVPTLLESVDGMVRDWMFDRIIFAHGTNPYTKNAAHAFHESWHVLESKESNDVVTDHSIKPSVCETVCC